MSSMRKCLLALCLGLVNVASAAAQLCPYNVTECSCSDNSVSCFNLQEIPPLTNGSNVISITRAIFDTGNITTVHIGCLPPGLVSLEFIGHPLTNISGDAFNNSATTLRELAITKSELENLPQALLGLKNLTSLTIEDTNIYVWDSGVIQHIANTLTELNLLNVGLQKLPDWFSHFRLLTTAELSQNPLESIPEDAFIYIKNTLQSLRLKQCNFTSIPEALSTLNNLTLLDISNNSIRDQEVDELASFPIANIIEHLYLSSMKLTRMPDLSNMTSLRELYLDSNQIVNSSVGVFPWFVRTVHLEHNNLTSVPVDIDDLSELSTLILSFNKITEVGFAMFPRQLKYLDLSYNHLTKISNTFSTEDSFLETLLLHHNPITDIAPSAFNNLVWLQQLDLQYTKLTSLPSAFTSLGRLSTLELSHITSLSCTPAPSLDLVKWCQSFTLGGVHIYGNCNNGMSVYDYLTTWTTRALIPWKRPTRPPAPQGLTTQDNITTGSYSGVLKAGLLQICCCLLMLASMHYCM